MKKIILLPLLLLVFASNAQKNDSLTKPLKEKSWVKKYNRNLVFSLGLNRFNGNYNQPKFADDLYDLNPIGSRYFAFTFERKNLITKNESVALFVKTGIGVSWNNFMFEGNNVITKYPSSVDFPESQIKLRKSKLTASYVNIPLMLDVKFRKGFITHLAAGGYVGYRITSYSKTKAEESGDKQNVTDRFFLNNTRYGVSAELGLKNIADLFINYDMNQVFETGKGPKVNAISFGVRF